MPKAKPRGLAAWEAVKIVERSRREKERFIDAAIAAALVDPEAAERVRQAYKHGEISYEQALKKFKEITEKKGNQGNPGPRRR